MNHSDFLFRIGLVSVIAFSALLVLSGAGVFRWFQSPVQAQAEAAPFGYIEYTSARLAVLDGEVRGLWVDGTYQPLNAWGSGCWQLVAVTRTVSAVDYAVFSREFGIECNGEGK